MMQQVYHRERPAHPRVRSVAAEANQRALDLCGNRAERAYLQRRLEELLAY